MDEATGDALWSAPAVADRRSSQVAFGDAVFAVHRDDRNRELVALDAADGAERWRVAVEAREPPVATDEVVYAQVDDGVVGLDRTDGSVVSSSWSTQMAPVARVGDMVYAAGDGGRIRALDATDDLEPLWMLTTEEVQVSDTIEQYVYHVTPVEGGVFVNAADAFYGIGPADGA